METEQTHTESVGENDVLTASQPVSQSVWLGPLSTGGPLKLIDNYQTMATELH